MPIRRLLPDRARAFYIRYRASIGYVLLVAYITVIGGLAYDRLSDNDSQFCQVASQRLVDKQHQVAQTNQYLTTVAGQEPTALNTFIRQISLPRLREEIRSDQRSLPADCRDEYDHLQEGK